MDLPQLFKNYLITKKKSSPVTAKNYSADLRKFLRWFEESFLKSFSPQDLNQDILVLFEKTKGSIIKHGEIETANQASARSFARYLASLRNFGAFLKEDGYIRENPFDQLQTGSHQLQTKSDPWHIKEFKDYLYVDGASKATIKNYLVDIYAFASWIEQTTGSNDSNLLSCVTTAAISEYKGRLVSILGLSPKSVNRKLSSIRKYLNFAYEQGLTAEKEAGIENYELKEDNKKTGFISLEDIKNNDLKLNVQVSNYSSLPFLRLIQKLLEPYWAFEEAAASKIAKKIKNLRLKAKVKGEKTEDQNKNLATGRQVKNYPKDLYAPHQIATANLTWHQKLLHHAKHTRPNWYKRYHSYSFVHYLHFAVMVIYAGIIGFIIYSGLSNDAENSRALASATPPRVLSFQGRLTDSNDNPITQSTNIRFQIYNDLSATGAGVLLWQEVNKVTPDNDGIFTQLLGAGLDCIGQPLGVQSTSCAIPQSVFANNSSLYLGITIENTAELTPRQQLATVAYAANSESLQGMLPITDSSIIDNKNTILALDGTGTLTMTGSTAPTFVATGAEFKIRGESLLLSTNAGSGGNVQIVPDGDGKIDLQKAIFNSSSNGTVAAGAVEVHDRMVVVATESAAPAFIVNNNTTGGDIISASSSGTTRFKIENDGDLGLAAGVSIDTLSTGTISIGGSLATTLNLGRSAQGITLKGFTGSQGVLYTNGSGNLTQASTSTSNLCLISGSSSVSWSTCPSSSFKELSGAIVPLNSTEDFLIGGQSTASAKFSITNVNGTSGVIASLSGNLIVMPATGSAGNIGINTTTPRARLDVNGSATLGGSLTFYSNPAIQSTENQTLTLGGDTTGNIVIDAGSDLITLSDNTTLSQALTVNGNTTFGNSNADTLTINAGSSGSGISFGDSSFAACTLKTSGGVLTCGTDNTGGGSLWDITNGTIYPVNSTLDLTLGGTTTASAKFAVLNIDGTATPVASVSATGGSDEGKGISLSGNGTIQGLRNNTLTIGGNTTGNIALMPLNGSGGVGIGTASPLAALDVRGGSGTLAAATVSAQSSFAALSVDNTIGDLFTASSSGVSQFVIKNNGNVGIGNVPVPTAMLDVAGTASISSALTFRGGAGSIQTTSMNTLTIGGGTTGDISFSPGNSTRSLFLSTAGNVGLGGGSYYNTNIGSSIGFRMDESTTNLITNPSFETDTSGWVTNGPGYWISAGTTLTQETSASVFGRGSSHLVVNPAAQYKGMTMNLGTLSNGQVYTASFWVKGTTGGQSLNAFLGENSSAATNITFTPTATWTKYTLSWTATSNTAYFGFRNWSNQTYDIYIDGIQVEQKSFATSYADGSLGPGYSWTGTAHASTSTRTAGTFTADNIGFFGGGLGVNYVGSGTALNVIQGSSGNAAIFLGGNVGVGTATPGARLQVGDQGDGTTATANSWNNFSDIRFKENIKTISNSLDKVLSLRGVSFNWRKSGFSSIGFIAQEVEEVVPEIVSTDASGYKSLDYGKITPLLINAIGEQNIEIQRLGSLISEFDLFETDLSSLNITAKTDSQGNVITPHYYSLTDIAGGPITRIGAFADAVIGNLRAGAIAAREITTDSLVVATNSMTVGGQTLSEYIVNVVKESGILNQEPEIISGLASIDQINTNIISPLAGEKVEVAGDLNVKGKTVIASESAAISDVLLDVKGSASVSGTLTANNASVSGNLASQTITANDVYTEDFEARSATISGTLYASNIKADSIEGLEAKIQNLVGSNASISSVSGQTISAHHANLANAAIGTASGSLIAIGSSESLTTEFIDITNLSADLGTFREGLIALGPSTFGQATFLDGITIGTTLIIGTNSIDTLGQTLEIQPLKQGAISLMAGAVRVETDGTLKVTGNAEFAADVKIAGSLSPNIISPLPDQDLTIDLGANNPNSSFLIHNSSNSAVLSINQTGDLIASGTATFNKLNFALAAPAFALSDTQAIATASAGTASLKKFRTEITINNPLVTRDSLIYITPVGNTNNQIVSLLRQVPNDPENRIEGSFTVGIGLPAAEDIKFNWIIIN